MRRNMAIPLNIWRSLSERSKKGDDLRRLVMDALYPWQAAYLAAVCETDDSLMDGRILAAR